ncbi:response regulator, partial [Mitsuaria sp. GD03876]|uniref:response regulator n=1 Tax=Mitsuaria sp. GD03876 TaxID=2975399 RepID=UPI002446A5DD
ALGHLLELAGADVRTAGSVEAGWHQSADTPDRAPPQALVSDVAMPGEDGYALIRRLRERERANGEETPLYAVALTGLATLQDRDAAIAAGFDDHLAKPVDVDLLIEKLLVARPR